MTEQKVTFNEMARSLSNNEEYYTEPLAKTKSKDKKSTRFGKSNIAIIPINNSCLFQTRAECTKAKEKALEERINAKINAEIKAKIKAKKLNTQSSLIDSSYESDESDESENSDDGKLYDQTNTDHFKEENDEILNGKKGLSITKIDKNKKEMTVCNVFGVCTVVALTAAAVAALSVSAYRGGKTRNHRKKNRSPRRKK